MICVPLCVLDERTRGLARGRGRQQERRREGRGLKDEESSRAQVSPLCAQTLTMQPSLSKAHKVGGNGGLVGD